MSFTAWIIANLILLGALLLWAKYSRHDFGLKRPSISGSEPWLIAYLAWSTVNWFIIPALSVDTITEFSDYFGNMTKIEFLIIAVFVAPIVEEILFRGAIFALLFRWSCIAAVVVPSIIWGVLHYENGDLSILYFSVSGMILAMIRLRSGSIYLPLALHSTDNFLIVSTFY